MSAIPIIQIIYLLAGLSASFVLDRMLFIGMDVIAFTMISLGIISFIGCFFIKKSNSKNTKYFMFSNIISIVIMVLYSLFTDNKIFTDFEFILLSQDIYIFDKAIPVVALEHLISVCCSMSLAVCLLSVAITFIHKIKNK